MNTRRSAAGWLAGLAVAALAVSCSDRASFTGPEFDAPGPAFATHSVPATSRIYFTDGGFSHTGPPVPGRIRRVNTDGSGLVDLVNTEPITPFKPWNGFSRPQGMAIDPINRIMYWVDFASGLFSANLDGTGAGMIGPLPGPGYHSMQGVDVDEVGGKVYWGPTHRFFSPGSPGQIRSSNLDGTGTTVLLSNGVVFFPGLLAVDPAGGKMYWGDTRGNRIMVANLNGTGVQILLGAPYPRGIALDVGAGMIYFTSAAPFGGGGRIFRANLNGTGLQQLVTGLNFPFGIALDLGAGKMYWTDLSADKIQSANLNGSNVQDVITGLDSPQGIALEPFLPVEIDIKPGSDPNSIKLGSKGVIPVAILTTAVADGDAFDFNAATVDPATVTLGNDDSNDTPVATKKNGSLFASLEDVDGDGDLDLALKFDQPAMEANGDLDAASTQLTLNGQTFGGLFIKGSDAVRVIP
jgi:sugar lactone lactonase YvrE